MNKILKMRNQFRCLFVVQHVTSELERKSWERSLYTQNDLMDVVFFLSNKSI